MNIQNRFLRVIYSRAHDVLIASDVCGRVHKLDADLQVVASSPVPGYHRPINAVCVTDRYVLARDRFGSLFKWDLDTLAPLDIYDGKLVCDARGLWKNEEPSPTPSRAIAVLDNKVYTVNGYNQIVVLDVDTFHLLDVRTSPSETFLDCICVDHPDIHAMSDVLGNLYIGNLAMNEFPIRVAVDQNVVHGVAYDKLHHRFWTTQDGGLGDDNCVRTGVTTVDADGTNFREFKLSHEDNEFIAFEPDGKRLFAGGFNGKIGVFDNTTRDFHLERIVGPLDFQIIAAAVVSADRIYALLQTGDIVRLDGEGNEECRTHYDHHCVWTLVPHPHDEGLLYAGTDQGVSLVRCDAGKFGTVQIEQIARHVHGFGIVKDVRPLPDGSYVGVSRKGDVFKARSTGAVQWRRQVLGVPRGIALSPDYDRCLVSTDEGTVWEYDTRSSAVVDRIEIGSPSYACVYTADGRRAITAEGGHQVHVYAATSHDIVGTVRGFTRRLKRIGRASNGEIFVVGPDGMFELDLDAYAIRRKFGDYLVSTKENGVLLNGFLHVGGYGYQVATYKHETGEIVDLQEELPDFTKAFATRTVEGGPPILLVGGRGGFIIAYRVFKGIPVKVRELYLR